MVVTTVPWIQILLLLQIMTKFFIYTFYLFWTARISRRLAWSVKNIYTQQLLLLILHLCNGYCIFSPSLWWERVSFQHINLPLLYLNAKDSTLIRPLPSVSFSTFSVPFSTLDQILIICRLDYHYNLLYLKSMFEQNCLVMNPNSIKMGANLGKSAPSCFSFLFYNLEIIVSTVKESMW